ncbi:NYN domain-containing protein [Pararobbsia silviterrae]|uniref:NYN domain-containing protein n=1 Tax=Pararobbsia silviterrae TaxID=1792498 RepID=A0A494Y5R6_9BURK|nr:NYN domain-containing protein [Pararobbsia silviterrae]RKP57432.1 NYN domain-containing protein [Pararobbsia silviterrae]
MATPNESVSMALFCDFENVALGVRDAKYEKFEIKPVLERLLLKGSIVVKKAYCDWERYKGFKASMHEANFELIEIPHVRQSGKNSADIRLVVDALDLCYTKSHVDTFVIISGDSDFSPLVSKLRENAKRVIGVGVKNSTSDLLVANCDEFIFYDDLVRERQRAEAKRAKHDAEAANKRTADQDKDKRRKDDAEARKLQAVEIAVETFDALVSEQGDGGKIWASVLKSAIKRRKPDFSESYYGFRAFGNLLEEARARSLLDFGRDDRSGTFVSRMQEGAASADGAPRRGAALAPAAQATPAAAVQSEPRSDARDGRQKDRKDKDRHARRRGGAHDQLSIAGLGEGAAAASDAPHGAGEGREPDQDAYDASDRAPERVADAARRFDPHGETPEAMHGETRSDAWTHAEFVSEPARDDAEASSEPIDVVPSRTPPKTPKAPRKTPARKTAKKKPAAAREVSSVDAAQASLLAPNDAPRRDEVEPPLSAGPRVGDAAEPVAPQAAETSVQTAAKTAAKKKAPPRGRRPRKAATPA